MPPIAELIGTHPRKRSKPITKEGYMSTMNRFLCFRQTRNMHESGFRYIEYGYLTYDENNNEVIEIVDRYDVVLSTYTALPRFNIDLTKSGWFRVLPRTSEILEWSYGGTIEVAKAEEQTNDTDR